MAEERPAKRPKHPGQAPTLPSPDQTKPAAAVAAAAAAHAISQADFLLVVAGAGMGIDSGIPSYEMVHARLDHGPHTYDDLSSPEV